MVTLPVGRFVMGAARAEKDSGEDEGPQREVTVLQPIAIGRCAVTFAQWDAAVAAGFSPGGAGKRPADNGWGRGDLPVINVSWNDAQAYCAWLNERLGLRLGIYRLPGEEEWEYACRAGTETAFSFGATITTAQANYDGRYVYGAGREGESRERTVAVGSLPANGWGLHEMHGNVLEWCEDVYGLYPSLPTDMAPLSQGKKSPRVLRGGSWIDFPQILRSACRGRNAPGGRHKYIGFRLARTLRTDAHSTVQYSSVYGQSQNGIVKWFNFAKGYGFLKPDGSDKDVFVHISELQKSGLTTLYDNARVTFDMVKDNQGKLSAGNIKLKK
jgi:formylglycine-generating enzyme required for sulfatase activity/cold shock CspA family protein